MGSPGTSTQQVARQAQNTVDPIISSVVVINMNARQWGNSLTAQAARNRGGRESFDLPAIG